MTGQLLADRFRVVGVDPGPTPGIVVLRYVDGQLQRDWSHIIQCSAGVAAEILGSILANGYSHWPTTLVQIEEFVVGRTSMRSGAAGSLTRDQIGFLTSVAEDNRAMVRTRNANVVKGWASNERLDAAGLLVATKGMRHAQDAARHALFAAVRDCGATDPLSRKAHV